MGQIYLRGCLHRSVAVGQRMKSKSKEHPFILEHVGSNIGKPRFSMWLFYETKTMFLLILLKHLKNHLALEVLLAHFPP